MLSLFRTRNCRPSIGRALGVSDSGKEQKKLITSLSLAGKSLFAMDIFLRVDMTEFSIFFPVSTSAWLKAQP